MTNPSLSQIMIMFITLMHKNGLSEDEAVEKVMNMTMREIIEYLDVPDTSLYMKTVPQRGYWGNHDN